MARTSNGDRVSLGGIMTSLITAAVIAGAGGVVGVAVLNQRANASDQKVEAIDSRQRAIEKNQAVLVREAQWTSAKLDALLAAKGVAVPSPPPLKAVE